jgi:outer membrane protein assembly factor BamB
LSAKTLARANTKSACPKIPLFAWSLKQAPGFEILDNDARDGQAVVQMPTELREGYTRVRSPRSKELLRSLTLKDPLYKLTQELVRNDEGPGSFLLTANPPRPSTPLRAHLKPLKLSSVCSEEPDEYRLWKIENPNNQPVPYGWEVEGSPQSGNEVAPPGESYFETETENGNNKVTLTVEGKKDINRVSLPTQCREGEEPGVSIWWKLGVRPFPIPATWNAGSDYTLEFQPQNIPAFTLRWIKSQASAPDFPPGLAEIGPAGGNVDLPGVAKLAVPAGAVNQKTLFRISQVSQAMGLQTQCESRILAAESCVPGFDFASALVKLEPFKLQLNTPASLTLVVDSARLGNNHPGTLRYKANQTSGLDPESWVFDPLLAPAPGSALSATTQTALPVKTLAHVAAFMPVLVQPQDGFVPVQNGSLLLSEKESHVSNADAQALLNQLSGALSYYSSLGLPSPVGGQHEWQSGPVLPVTVMKAGALAGVSEVFGRSWVAGPPEKEQISPTSKFLGSKILLRQCSVSGEHCGSYAAQETVAQDAFHLVQQSYYRDASGQNVNLNFGKYQQYLGFNNGTNSEDRNWVKSSASVMGAYYSTRQLSLTPSQDSPYFIDLQSSQAQIGNSLNLSNVQVQESATGLFSHLVLSSATGPAKVAEFTTKLGLLWSTDVEADSQWSPSLKALHQSTDVPTLYQSYTQAAWMRENLNLFSGNTPNRPSATQAILNAQHLAGSPLSLPVELGALSGQILEIAPDPALGTGTLFVRLKPDTANSAALLEPPSLAGALVGSSLASSNYFKAQALVLNRAENLSESNIGSFAPLSGEALAFENFGNQATHNVLLVNLSNGLNQRKDSAAAKIKATLEVYFAPSEPTEEVEDPLPGDSLWQAPLSANFTVGEAAPLLHNGLLYFVGPSGQILAQKADSGQIEWQRSLPTPLSASPALGSDGSLYLGGVNGTFYALNPDGSTRWSFTPDEPNSFRLGGVALDEGKGVLYTGGTAEAIYALNIQTGQEVWRFKARAPIDSAPIITSKRLYVLALDQTLFALDQITGEYIWEFQTGQPISDITPALTESGEIIIGSADTAVYCISRNGHVNWSYLMGGGMSASPIIGPEGNVYTSSSDGNLYAFDFQGNFLWKYNVGASIQAAPVVDLEGTVYVGTSQGKLYSVFSDGSPNWEKEVNGGVRGRLIIDDEGVLYGVTEQGQTFSVVTGSSGSGLGGWPMEHGNLLGWGL